MSTTTKAEQARTIIASLTVNLYNAIAIEAMLSRSNDDPALREAYDHTYEVHGLNVIHHTLIDQLITTLMRMHDPGRSDEASLHRIFGLLDDEDVMAVFRAKARGWNPVMPDLTDSNEQAVVDAVHDSRSRWAELTAGAPIKRLREYRNRHLAHSLIKKPETDKPIYNDMFEVLEETSPIIKKLRLAVMGNDIDVDDVRRIHGRYADEFWTGAMAGVLARQEETRQ